MNNKGFAFIETIITVVVLSAALLTLYGSYNSIIKNEKKRLYYDDVAYIYRTNYIRSFLEENSDIENVKSWALNNDYIITIGYDFERLFTDEQINNGAKNALMNIVNKFHVQQMVLVKSAMLDDCIDYNGSCSDDDTICLMCKKAIDNNYIGRNLNAYINTLNSKDYDYYLAVEYAEKYNDDGTLTLCTPEMDINCTSFYVSLGI